MSMIEAFTKMPRVCKAEKHRDRKWLYTEPEWDHPVPPECWSFIVIGHSYLRVEDSWQHRLEAYETTDGDIEILMIGTRSECVEALCRIAENLQKDGFDIETENLNIAQTVGNEDDETVIIGEG